MKDSFKLLNILKKTEGLSIVKTKKTIVWQETHQLEIWLSW